MNEKQKVQKNNIFLMLLYSTYISDLDFPHPSTYIISPIQSSYAECIYLDRKIIYAIKMLHNWNALLEKHELVD